MTSQDQHSDRRTFLKALAGALGGFVREYRAALGEPPPPPRQELAVVETEVKALNDAVLSLAQATDRNQQAVLDTLQRIADRMEQVDARIAVLEQAHQPEQAARWRALLKRLGELALLLVGPTAIAAALRDAFVQDELYPALRDRLLGLLTHTETLVGPLEVATVSPAPVPTLAESGTPMPAEIEAAPAEPRGQDLGPLNFDWVEIPAGPFLMGSDPHTDPKAQPDELPQHRVYLSTFWISRTPVTNHQFARFVQATGYKSLGSSPDYIVGDSHWVTNDAGDHWVADVTWDHPVTDVTWDDALAFSRWAGVRLPSEAEWEKAARGTHGRLYPWGNQPPDARRCNFDRVVVRGWPTPVGSYPAGANSYGVLDMAGNVWEWCSTLWGEDWLKPGYAYPYRTDDGREDLSRPGYRILRGGSWGSPDSRVRCAFRGRQGKDYWTRVINGFRVARSSSP